MKAGLRLKNKEILHVRLKMSSNQWVSPKLNKNWEICEKNDWPIKFVNSWKIS